LEADVTFRVRVPLLVLLVFGVAHAAVAGPPLLCHPYDIGSAQSLPWSSGGSWSSGRPDYNLASLVSDTKALLTPAMPVVARMETLRRAALYASADANVAAALARELVSRVESSQQAGKPDPLALLDAAYLVEALRQISQLRQMDQFRDRAEPIQRVVSSMNGVALIRKALALQPEDPALHFAAALISADNNRPAYLEHAAKARAGSHRDALLAKNLSHIE
jgi:hypothetical protein